MLEIVVPAIGTLIGIGLVKKTTELIPKSILPSARPRLEIERPRGLELRQEKTRPLLQQPIIDGLAPARFSVDVRQLRPR